MKEYGGFWIRFAASLIDAILFLVLEAPFVLLFYGTGYYTSDELIAGPADIVITWIAPFLIEIAFWHYKRATPGKMLFKLQIVDADTGESLSWGQCVLRYIGYFLAALPCGIGLLMIAFDERKRGWHDRLANSVVRYRL